VHRDIVSEITRRPTFRTGLSRRAAEPDSPRARRLRHPALGDSAMRVVLSWGQSLFKFDLSFPHEREPRVAGGHRRDSVAAGRVREWRSTYRNQHCHLRRPAPRLRTKLRSPRAGVSRELIFQGAALELVTFLARPRKVTQRRPPLKNRAVASPVLLDKFGVCGTRSKNEKTHWGCELRQVLDHNTELACVTRRFKRGNLASSVAMRAIVWLLNFEFEFQTRI
jgi:hypothetical protein